MHLLLYTLLSIVSIYGESKVVTLLIINGDDDNNYKDGDELFEEKELAQIAPCDHIPALSV